MNNFEIPEPHRKGLFKLIIDVSKILKDHNIIYWIDGGTMLGAIRDKGFIKHDDDIDFGTIPTEYNRILKIKDEFIKMGYSFDNINGCIKIYIPYLWCKYQNRIIATPTLDIFSYEMHNQYYVLKEIGLRKRFLKSKHYKNDLFPLKTVNFEHLKLPCPNNPIPYLNGQYPEWQSKILVDVRTDYDNTKIEQHELIRFN